jgi:hypothetical protein
MHHKRNRKPAMSTPFYDLASLVVVPSGYKSGKIYAQKPLTTDGQLTFTRASTATRVNASGLIESVASGVPRLDYQGSTCPKLLLEPQRTNLVLYSEQINTAPNVVESTTYTANAYTSPDGTQNAAQFTETTANDRHGFYQYSTVSSQAHTASIFTKQTGRRYIAFTTDATGTQYTSFFDLQTKSVLTSGTGHTCSVQDYGNGWLRLIVSFTASSGSRYFIWGGSPNGTDFYYTGSSSFSQTFWGYQLEAGAYATSYIPTTSAAVTRLADAAYKTGISSLIGQTEGTLFVDFYYDLSNNTPNGSDKSVMTIRPTGGGTNNEIAIVYYGDESGTYGKTIQVFVSVGGASQCLIKTPQNLTNGYYKVAFAYKQNDFALYVNGAQIGTDSSGSVPTCSELYLNDPVRVASPTAPKQALLFKTRLTNAQLAELTSL